MQDRNNAVEQKPVRYFIVLTDELYNKVQDVLIKHDPAVCQLLRDVPALDPEMLPKGAIR